MEGYSKVHSRLDSAIKKLSCLRNYHNAMKQGNLNKPLDRWYNIYKRFT